MSADDYREPDFPGDAPKTDGNSGLGNFVHHPITVTVTVVVGGGGGTDPGYMIRKIRKFRTDKFDT